jgi:hypothetical protein
LFRIENTLLSLLVPFIDRKEKERRERERERERERKAKEKLINLLKVRSCFVFHTIEAK